LEALANKLDADAGVLYSGFFNDIDSKTGVISANTEASATVIT
jgi:hypothetical protein